MTEKHCHLCLIRIEKFVSGCGHQIYCLDYAWALVGVINPIILRKNTWQIACCIYHLKRYRLYTL